MAPDFPEIRRLRRGERDAFLDLAETAFGGQRDMFARYLETDPALSEDDTFVAVEGDTLLSGLQIFTKRIRLRGEEVGLGGIGTVATHPAHERRGLASALLRSAIAEMERRGMALSLLFAARIGFYARLGWSAIPYPVWSIHRGSAEPAPGRPLCDADQPAVRRLYDAYCASIDLTSIRDGAYWAGQLAYAGNPDEAFRVAERAGRVVAYARRIEFFKLARAMEYARADGAEGELAGLLLELAPRDGALLAPRAPDPELAAALARAGARVDEVRFPDAMWRVLDRPRLLTLADLGERASDEEILRELVDRESALYWTSDRF